MSSELRTLVATAEIIDAKAWLTLENENMLNQVELSMFKTFKHFVDAIMVFAEQKQRRKKRRMKQQKKKRKRQQKQRWMKKFGSFKYDEMILDDPIAAVFKEARIMNINFRERDAFSLSQSLYLFENDILNFDLNSKSSSLWEVLSSSSPQTHQQKHQKQQHQ